MPTPIHQCPDLAVGADVSVSFFNTNHPLLNLLKVVSIDKIRVLLDGREKIGSPLWDSVYT